MAQLERFPKPLSVNSVDALRAEGQSLTPKEMSFVQNFALETQEVLENTYGSFMNPRAIERNANIVERIIVIPDIGECSEEILGIENKKDQKSSLHGCIRGTSISQVGHIYITDPKNLWGKFQFEKDAYLQFYCSENEARIGFKNAVLAENIAHEITHQYQDNTLTEGFAEMGARYYKEEVMDNLELSSVQFVGDFALSQGYQFLIQEFGDSVHKLAFGSLRDFPLRREILSTTATLQKELLSGGVTGWELPS